MAAQNSINDAQVSIRQMMDWVEKFCAERGWDPAHGAKDLAIGLVTEGSELLEIFRFVPEGEVPRLMTDLKSREAIGDELADSLYFILRFAQVYGFDLSTCLREKLIKNEIKYPALKK